MDVIPTGNASDLDATEDKNEDISIGLLFASKAIVQLIGTGQTPVNFGQLHSICPNNNSLIFIRMIDWCEGSSERIS